MQRGIVTMNWRQLYLQPRIVCATRCQAEQVYKGHRDMCARARAWPVAYVIQLLRATGCEFQSGGLVGVTSSGMF